ncbi:helix-turn-helix transcriptional regulator [bacterium]|nr:helix-turn-helix transcriptional regulator [bacterium]
MTTNLLWGVFVSQNRKSQGLTRRRLAEMADIDPSYITIIEKKGVIPRRDKVIRLAEALNHDTDRALLMAGYAPENLPAETAADKNEPNSDGNRQDELSWLHPSLRLCISQLSKLSDSDQISAAELLEVFVRSLDQRKSLLNSKGA